MEIKQCILWDNDVVKANKPIVGPVGIVVHSTGVNQTWLGRYVQPSAGECDYDELIKALGKNRYGNSWNRTVNKCVHYMIGEEDNGTLACYQIMPLDIKCGGVASGAKGSYNTDHIQFEMCEDNLANEDYFNRVMQMGQELCAYLCEHYGWTVDAICSHKECAARGYGSSHGDPENWLTKYGKDMDWFRAEVQKLLDEHKKPEWVIVYEDADTKVLKLK